MIPQTLKIADTKRFIKLSKFYLLAEE